MLLKLIKGHGTQAPRLVTKLRVTMVRDQIIVVASKRVHGRSGSSTIIEWKPERNQDTFNDTLVVALTLFSHDRGTF